VDAAGARPNWISMLTVAEPVVNLTMDSILVRDNSLAATESDGRVVVLSLHAGAYISFNDAASEIWRLLAEPRAVGEICDALSQSHDVDFTTASTDILPFLQRLIERKLVRRAHLEAAR